MRILTLNLSLTCSFSVHFNGIITQCTMIWKILSYVLDSNGTNSQITLSKCFFFHTMFQPLPDSFRDWHLNPLELKRFIQFRWVFCLCKFKMYWNWYQRTKENNLAWTGIRFVICSNYTLVIFVFFWFSSLRLKRLVEHFSCMSYMQAMNTLTQPYRMVNRK